MKYALINADESRQATADAIWIALNSFGDQQVHSKVVDGRSDASLELAQISSPYRVVDDPGSTFPLRGHLGVWYSVMNALDYAPLLVIEDDALLKDDFDRELNKALYNLPADADFLALFTPDARHHLFNRDMHEYSPGDLVRVWQPNGGVAIYWTARGAESFRALVEKDGMRAQWDNQLMQYAWDGRMKGYTFRPFEGIVGHAFGSSIVQNTEPA